MLYVYKASAGSGKTFTLVKEFLKLLLGTKNEDGSYALNIGGSNRHRPILAITFTNKATNEMKQRIVKELDLLAFSPADSPYMKDFTDTFKTSEKAVSDCAKKALKDLLHDFTNFNVSTIDTFFQTILRTFAYESDLSHAYNIELNDEYAIAIGISDLKQSLKTQTADKQLLGWLEKFMQANIDKGNSWNIFSQNNAYGDTLYRFAKCISSESVRQYSEQLYDYLHDKSLIVRFQRELDRKSKEAWQVVRDEAARFLEIAPAVKYLRKFDEKIRALSLDDWKDSQLNYVCDTAENPEKWFAKDALSRVDTDTIDLLKDCLVTIRDKVREIDTYGLIFNHIYSLGLLGDINAFIRDFKKENNIILLSDTNEMLRRIISKDDTPFIYERIGVRLQHFLIDEFQDTSRMQWYNLVPLMYNSLAAGNDSLIIGDVKQSIYRFRNSDPYLLKDEIYKDSELCSGGITVNGDDIRSNTNWRSARDIVLWNNTFFTLLAHAIDATDGKKAADSDSMRAIYGNVVQQIAPSNIDKPGYILVAGLPTDDFEATALDRMIDTINDMINRGYGQKDITVLVNTNREGETAIARILGYNIAHPDNRQINVVSEESLLINRSPAVKIIVAILSLLDNNDGVTDTAEPVDGTTVPKRSLAFLMKQYEYNVSSGNDPALAFAMALTDNQAEDISPDELLGSGDCAGIGAIIERIIKRYIPKTLTENNTVYIQAFIDAALDYAARYGSNLHLFLRWWDETKDRLSVSSPDNIDAVKVMTVHKSKGLEFPCVIIPFCNWDFDKEGLEWVDPSVFSGFDAEIVPPILPVKRTQKKRTLFDSQFCKLRSDCIMDSLNKTYVAFTRASRELVVFYPDNTKSQTLDMPSMLSTICRAGKEAVDSACKPELRDFVLHPADFFDPDAGRLEIGDPTVPERKKNTTNVLPVEVREMPAYEVNERSNIWHFEIPERALEDRDSPKFRGIVLHNLMRSINKPEDVYYAVGQALSRGTITRSEAREFSEIISHGISHPKATEWFQKGNRLIRERPVITSDGQEYRPDLIVCTPDGRTIVVDYKFGEREEEKYKHQVRNYMQLIARGGFKNIEGYVWYVTEDLFVKV